MTELLNVEPLVGRLARDLEALFERRQITAPLIIGIRTGGVWIAEALHAKLGLADPWGSLDISFYRDDFERIGLNPQVRPSELPFATDDRHIVLVDDVIMSGRTVRAAMNEIFDYGRPASITLVALVDLDARELPVQPDLVGKTMALNKGQRIKLSGPEPLRLEIRDPEQACQADQGASQ